MEDKKDIKDIYYEKFVATKLFWQVVCASAVIVVGAGGFLLSEIRTTKAKLDVYRDLTFNEMTEIKEDISAIKSDMRWIKELFDDYNIRVNNQ